MPVVSLDTDTGSLTLTIVAEYPVPPARAWTLWADADTLGRWWGPPGYPCTVDHHELVAGGRVAYHMTGPDGTEYPGWWEVLGVDAPRRLHLRDGFSDASGAPADHMPVTTMTVDIDESGLADTRPGDAGPSDTGRADAGPGCRMVMVSTFPDRGSMHTLIEMGMVEGMRAAMSQIDDLLTA